MFTNAHDFLLTTLSVLITPVLIGTLLNKQYKKHLEGKEKFPNLLGVMHGPNWRKGKMASSVIRVDKVWVKISMRHSLSMKCHMAEL